MQSEVFRQRRTLGTEGQTTAFRCTSLKGQNSREKRSGKLLSNWDKAAREIRRSALSNNDVKLEV